MTTMFVNACMRGEDSRTLALCREYLQGKEEVVEVDLATLGLKPFDAQMVAYRTEKQKAKAWDDPIFDLSHQFAEADEVVIGAPYWDLSFPAALKVYMEHVSVCDIAFHYTEDARCEGICKADRLTYIASCGGFVEGANFGYEYFCGIAKMFGIPETRFVGRRGAGYRGYRCGGPDGQGPSPDSRARLACRPAAHDAEGLVALAPPRLDHPIRLPDYLGAVRRDRDDPAGAQLRGFPVGGSRPAGGARSWTPCSRRRGGSRQGAATRASWRSCTTSAPIAPRRSTGSWSSSHVTCGSIRSNGYLFFKELSPLAGYAEVVLYHHMHYRLFTDQDPAVRFPRAGACRWPTAWTCCCWSVPGQAPRRWRMRWGALLRASSRSRRRPCSRKWSGAQACSGSCAVVSMRGMRCARCRLRPILMPLRPSSTCSCMSSTFAAATPSPIR